MINDQHRESRQAQLACMCIEHHRPGLGDQELRQRRENKDMARGVGSSIGREIDNIHMDNVRNPIIIDQFYCLSSKEYCSNHTSAVYLSDIKYTGIKGTYDIRSPPMHFGCSDSIPCTNITISDVELLPAMGDVVLDPFCWNVYGELPTVTIPPVSCLLEGVPPRSILENDIGYC